MGGGTQCSRLLFDLTWCDKLFVDLVRKHLDDFFALTFCTVTMSQRVMFTTSRNASTVADERLFLFLSYVLVLLYVCLNIFLGSV